MISFDFLKEYQKKGRELIRNRNIQQYAILKCSFDSNENFYKNSITRYYQQKQIQPNWKFVNWSTPTIPNEGVLLKIKFKLIKPFISKDDEIFWPKENPICKEKVFKIPMIRASSWKGALRCAAMKCVLEGNDNEKIKRRKIMLRLFGTEKDNIEKYLDGKFKEANILERWKKEIEELKKKLKVKELHLRGRLIFFPTFFDQIDLDVIAPHDRKTRTITERGPILFEVVPEGTNGTFSLLYYPFGLIEKLNSENENEKRNALNEIKEDFEFLATIIPEVLETYGFGAKTSSGYGIAEINKICVNGQERGTDWKKVLEVVEDEYGRK